ncbi:MAG TPA: FtsX-like permease family protein [Terriglobales bacterium]|nr:FtsX-like permease family protein [Terriglobales bacterium]
MKAYDALELATRNLRESILRNSLTTLGIAVGVASLVAMLSLGVGLQELAGRRLTQSGLFNTVVVYQQQNFGRGPGRGNDSSNAQASGNSGFSSANTNSSGDANAPATNPLGASEGRVVDEPARQELSKLPNVLEVYPEVRFFGEVRYNNAPHATAIAALPPSSRQSDAFDSLQGSFFSSPDAQEALVLTEFAKDLEKNPKDVIGRELSIRYAERKALASGESAGADAGLWGFSVIPREQKLKIVGVIDSEPYGGMRGFARARVFMPLALAEKLNIVQTSDVRSVMRGRESRTYQSLIVRVKDPNAVQAVEDAARKMGFATFSLLDATRNLRRFFAILDLFLGIFGSLALAVASLGIINTLVMAILERRREIGIMKAIGASDGDVRTLFFAEAATMGFTGGALGVFLGWAIGRIINTGTNIYLQRQQLPPEQIWLVPWWLVGGAIGFSIVVSLVSGLYPAARAARLDPVQALRYE